MPMDSERVSLGLAVVTGRLFSLAESLYSLLCVASPACPSPDRLFWRWNALTASSVASPYTPSTPPA